MVLIKQFTLRIIHLGFSIPNILKNTYTLYSFINIIIKIIIISIIFVNQDLRPKL